MDGQGLFAETLEVAPVPISGILQVLALAQHFLLHHGKDLVERGAGMFNRAQQH